MKLDDILEEGPLTWKQRVAAGLLAASSTLPFVHKAHEYQEQTRAEAQAQQEAQAGVQEHQKARAKKENLVHQISADFNVGVNEIKYIMNLADKYENPDFPTAEDILAVIRIESEFNAQAKSKLKKDPAIGLMQVRPKTNGLKRSDLQTREQQIKHGTAVLSKYYSILKDKQAALEAYNVGLRNYRNGHRAPRYINKFKNAIAYINTPTPAAHNK